MLQQPQQLFFGSSTVFTIGFVLSTIGATTFMDSSDTVKGFSDPFVGDTITCAP